MYEILLEIYKQLDQANPYNEQKDLMKKLEKVLCIWRNIIFPPAGR